MIKICGAEHLSQCVEIAFARNNQPEHNCAYCPNSRESIHRDFEFMLSNPACIMIGYFVGDTLSGILGCCLNPDNRWVDCVGPFFMNRWSDEHARDMFLFAQTTLSGAVRFNFYFNAENVNCHRLMEALSAERQDNEYILVLDKADYKPQHVKHRVIRDTNVHRAELIQLHDDTFPDVYVTGRDIVDAVGKTREVFCALDEYGAFAGYGVLKYAEDSKHLTAEIFAVKREKRGKGYGWALLNTVVDSAFSDHEGIAIDLVVDKMNTRARDLYYSCGFRLAVENAAFCLRT